jgi:hypothetical protein
LQLDGGQNCKSWTFREYSQGGMKCQAHIAHHKQLDACHIPFCSYNYMGAEGAKELVKGDWPELRILNIRWVRRPMVLWIYSCKSWARHEVIS